MTPIPAVRHRGKSASFALGRDLRHVAAAAELLGQVKEVRPVLPDTAGDGIAGASREKAVSFGVGEFCPLALSVDALPEKPWQWSAHE